MADTIGLSSGVNLFSPKASTRKPACAALSLQWNFDRRLSFMFFRGHESWSNATHSSAFDRRRIFACGRRPVAENFR
ncbi:hypothetical protein [Rhizobium sp. FKL33]|uniref:hypothetical protein n=1 Tax=Rhizobium sp. FKL33 TaxID=2562307 RepID=UPI00148594B6|nr:hypothetical protein [Rhizobium sp. FKL33]